MPACHAGDRRFESGRVRQFRHPDPFLRSTAIGRSVNTRLVIFVVVALIVAACGSSTPPTAAPGSSLPPTAAVSQPVQSGASAPVVATAQPQSSTQPGPTGTPKGSPPTSTPTGTPAATPPPTSGRLSMPFVPVVNYWSTRTSMPLDEVKAALEGSSAKYSTIVVPSDDADALAAAAGVALGASVQRGTADEVVEAVKVGGLGFLRISDVVPSVRALGIDDVNLFGEKRISDVSQWPLTASVASGTEWDQSRDWTLVSAGDIMGDRGVRTAVEDSGKGPSYLFNGGTSKVDRIKCCSFFNYQYPVVSRTGNAGAVKDMIQGADFAMANLE